MEQNEKLDRLYGRIKSHHEHSDEMYIKYSTSFMAISTAILGSLLISNTNYFVNGHNIFYIYIVLFLCIGGALSASTYNNYLQNEKTYQKEPIDYYDSLCAKHPEELLLEPTPFAPRKRDWKMPGWSAVPRNFNVFYFLLIVANITGLVMNACPI